MKLVLISDTHNKHHQLDLPPGDILIHAGDVSSRGSEREVLDFINWFSKLDYKYKIFIAGNHDWLFEKAPSLAKELIPNNTIYLNDAGVEVEGIKIWGSPVSPWFFDWAFNRQRGAEIQKHWDRIPKDTDILITHGPAYGMLDKTSTGALVGCQDLLETIQKLKIKLHICGHIHEAYGIEKDEETTYINASVVNLGYDVVNRPVVFEWESKV